MRVPGGRGRWSQRWGWCGGGGLCCHCPIIVLTTLCKLCSAAGSSHQLEICSKGLQSNFMDDAQRMSKLEVQCLNTVNIIRGAAAPVGGAHEAPHAFAWVQNMSDVLLRLICKTVRRVRLETGSTAEGPCRWVRQGPGRGHTGVEQGSCKCQAAQHQ